MKIQISDEVLAVFTELFENVRDNQFRIGDEVILLIDAHGCVAKEIIDPLAGALRVSPSSLYDYVRVSRTWTPELRAEYQAVLQWTVFRNSDPTDDRELLEQAVEEGWNVGAFMDRKYPTNPEDRLGKIIAWVNKLISSKDFDAYNEQRLIDIKRELSDILAEVRGE